MLNVRLVRKTNCYQCGGCSPNEPVNYELIIEADMASANIIRRILPQFSEDSNNDIRIETIVKSDSGIIMQPSLTPNTNLITISEPIRIKGSCEVPNQFAIVITSNNSQVSCILQNLGEVFIWDECQTLKLFFLFDCSKSRPCRNSRRSSRRSSRRCKRRCHCCNCGCNGNFGFGAGAGCGWEWIILFLLPFFFCW